MRPFNFLAPVGARCVRSRSLPALPLLVPACQKKPEAPATGRAEPAKKAARCVGGPARDRARPPWPGYLERGDTDKS